MKKLFIILCLAILSFAAGGDYYRIKTESANGVILATYTDKTRADTVQTVSVPGSAIPFHIVIKDGVSTDPTIVLVPKPIKMDTTNAVQEPKHENGARRLQATY